MLEKQVIKDRMVDQANHFREQSDLEVKLELLAIAVNQVEMDIKEIQVQWAHAELKVNGEYPDVMAIMVMMAIEDQQARMAHVVTMDYRDLLAILATEVLPESMEQRVVRVQLEYQDKMQMLAY
jgi:hypothetical protein